MTDRASKNAAVSSRFSFKGLAVVFLLALVIGLLHLVRNDEQVNQVVGQILLKREMDQRPGTALLKAIANVRIELSADELHKRCTQGDAQTVDSLLRAGLDPNLTDGEGRTGLHVAIEKDKRQVAAVLLAHPINVNIPDRQGRTALHYALRAKNAQIANYLLYLGAEVNTADAEGITPLHLAVRNAEGAVVSALLDKGADPKRASKNGETALSLAADSNEIVIKQLLRKAVGVLPNSNAPAGPQPTDPEASALLSEMQQAAAGSTPEEVAGPAPAKAHVPTAEEDARNPIMRDPAPEPEKERSAPNPVKAADRYASAPLSPLQQLTRVRVIGEPEGTWERSSKLSLKSIKVAVRNVGEYKAKGIEVSVTIPGGRDVDLKGPSELEKNALADYTYDKPETITRNGVLKAKVTCKNCRR